MTTEVISTVVPARAGFVGGGFMTTVHSQAARAARAELIGVASSSGASAVRAARTLNAGRGFDSVDALIADPAIDVVHVCTPNATHAPIAIAALQAGRNIICEKPLATTVADAEAIVRAAAEAGRAGTVPFVYRFHPMVREARFRVASGMLGPILSVQGAYLQDWLSAPNADDWRVDAALGGPSRAFADIGSHLVDLIEFVAGDRIARLVATTRTVYEDRAGRTPVDTEDLAALTVQFRGGAVGTLLVSQVSPGRKNSLVFELAGADAAVRFDQERPDELWIGGLEASQVVPRGSSLMSADATRLSTVPAGHPMGYQDAFNAFVADSYAFFSGQERPGLPTLADGLRAVTVTAAVLESAASGRWVEVPA